MRRCSRDGSYEVDRRRRDAVSLEPCAEPRILSGLMSKREERILQRHHRSLVDGTRQPYVVYLPRRYAPGRCPLLVWLHGFGGDETTGPGEFLMDLADESGYVLLLARGRGSVFYDGPGEVETMRVIDRTRREFRTLPGRTFAAGASMGGTGVLRLPSRYPHEFAAALAICGWSHWRYWYRKWYAPADSPEWVHPAHERALERADTIPALSNLLHVPVYLMHGARDAVVDVGESREAHRELSRLGYEVFYKEYARSGHRGFQRNWRAVFRWFEGGGARSWLGLRGGRRRARTRRKRVPDAPAEVRYTSLSPRHRRAYWAELDPADCNLPSHMHLVWDGSAVRAETENVSRLVLHRAGSPWEAARATGRRTGELVILWRGEEIRKDAAAAVEIDLEPRLGTKRPGLSGPISDAFRDPFVVVAGEGAAEREAAGWVEAWNRWMVPEGAKGIALRTPGSITRAEMRSRHLVLFGTPEENPLVGRIASHVDMQLSRRRVRLYRKRWKGEALGVRLIHPNPLAPGRYALVFFGEMGERTKQMETIGWYWPDWVVFEEHTECRRTAHAEWGAYDEAVERGDIDPAGIDRRAMPLQYLPDGWLGAGYFDASWGLA